MTRREYLQQIKTMLPENPVIAEIGVYRGDFSQMILDELKPQSLLLIDTWGEGKEEYQDGLKVSYSTRNDYLHVLGRFSLPHVIPCKMRSESAARILAKNHFDFVYLDGDHRYESVKWDLYNWSRLLKPEGIIGGHDYGNEVFTGVKIAVDEFCEERNLKVDLLSDEGDFVLI